MYVLNVYSKPAKYFVILENYSVAHDTPVQAEYAGSSIAGDTAGLPTYLQFFTLRAAELFSKASTVFQSYGNVDTLGFTNGSTAVR